MSAFRVRDGPLERGRRERSGLILVTGGTGFLGSHIAAALLRQGCRLALLVRPDRDASPRERVRRLMGWHGVDEGLQRAGLRVVAGDLREPGLGLEGPVREELARETAEIVHCASETSFAERKRPLVEEVNIGGLERVLDLAAGGRCASFHLVSTAYVAGRKRGTCPEELVSGTEFNNAYEETKCRAEWAARDRCRAEGIRLSIYRPSIVYGDSRTGMSLLFSAVYHPVRTALFLRDLYLKDIREKGGDKAHAAGVRVNPDGSVHLPLRVEVNDDPGINLIPVDYLAAAFSAIRDASPEGGVFHLVNERNTKIADLVAFSRRLFRLTGVEAVESRRNGGSGRNILETLFDDLTEVYRPYMRDERVFAAEGARSILEGKGIACPAFDYAVFSRCMEYAVATEWGGKLF